MCCLFTYFHMYLLQLRNISWLLFSFFDPWLLVKSSDPPLKNTLPLVFMSHSRSCVSPSSGHSASIETRWYSAQDSVSVSVKYTWSPPAVYKQAAGDFIQRCSLLTQYFLQVLHLDRLTLGASCNTVWLCPVSAAATVQSYFWPVNIVTQCKNSLYFIWTSLPFF